MQKNFSRLFIAIVFLVSIVALSAGTVRSTQAQVPAPAPVDGTLIVRGQVINAPDGARVQAARLDRTLAAETYVDPAGQYAFSPLPPDAYHLQVVDAQGHFLALTDDSQTSVLPAEPALRREYVLTVVVPPAEAQTAPASAVETAPPAEPADGVTAQATGQITGVVTAADTSLPLPYTTVKAYDGAGDVIGTGFSAYGTGAYSITGLATGTYTVYFSPSSSTPYAPKWYNNHYNQADATIVSVTDGVTTPAINASLDVGGQITGHVTAAVGSAPLEEVWVNVYTSPTASSYDYIDYAYTDATGLFTITGLAAGNYYLKYEKADYFDAYYNNKASLALANPVSVTLGGTTGNINAALILGGKITGTVTAASGGAPLSDVDVYVYASKTASSYEYIDDVYTDASGVYTLTGLETGTYYLKFEKTDYLPSYYNNRASLAEADAVSVTQGGVTGGINATLILGGKITGQVTASAGGASLASVWVQAYASRTDSTSIASAFTNSSGVYTITGLETGSYYLKFEKTDYLPAYYNNRASLAQADPVSVMLGGTTSNINASLILGGQITGHVTAAVGGASLADVYVYAYTSKTASSYNYVDYAYTDAAGVYAITGLAAGDYYLKVSPSSTSDYLPQYYQDQPDLAAADAVSVALGGVTGNINAALQLGGKINGRVTALESGAGLPQVQVSIYGYVIKCGVRELDLINSDTTDASGNYSVPQLATGNYIAYFSPLSYGASAAYLDEYYNNKASIDSADWISVTAGQVTQPIDAALTLGGTITGHITAVDGGAPLEDVYADVYSSTGNDWVAYDTTDATGAYTVTGLPAGSYKVEFDPDSSGAAFVYITEYYNDKATLALADPLSVAAGAVVSGIDAALARGGQFTGLVTAADGGAPLEEVDIAVYDSLGSWKGSGTTDASGAYITSGLATGSYKLKFSTEYGLSLDYLDEYYNDKPTFTAADPAALTAPGQTVVNAVLARGGSISGTVTSSLTGAPLDGVTVIVLQANGDEVKRTVTDVFGRYKVRGLPTGVYRVHFILSIPCSLLKYETYYNQKPNLNSADPVSVTAPADTPNIDAQLAVPTIITVRKCFLPLIRR